jgi:hypothetical protein
MQSFITLKNGPLRPRNLADLVFTIFRLFDFYDIPFEKNIELSLFCRIYEVLLCQSNQIDG